MRKTAIIIAFMTISLGLSARGKTMFEVKMDDKKVTVYDLKVSPQDSLWRMKGMDDKKGSKDIYEWAAFCYKEINSPAVIKVKAPMDVTSAKVLPTSRGIVPQIKGREISFNAIPGDRLTLEVNGDEYHSLHILPIK